MDAAAIIIAKRRIYRTAAVAAGAFEAAVTGPFWGMGGADEIVGGTGVGGAP